MTVRKRIRDPIHGLIVFDFDWEVDRAAWRLIDTPEFQRLRRIRQLGVSEFTFPGASHTRFAHSIGVFHVARRLMAIAEAGIALEERREHRARAALIAALLHDVGHGPFSHAFELAEKSRLKDRPGADKSHEAWTAEIIASPNHTIRPTIEQICGPGVVDLASEILTADPTDVYAAVVSSSFDADRLDYLQRDRLMSGSGAGAIDFDWLMDNLRVVRAPATFEEGDGNEAAVDTVQTFAFEEKALQAAEAFILARYHLYSQVYLHHATRGIEQTLTAFLQALAKTVADDRLHELPLSTKHPLVAYYAAETPTLDRYLALDDAVVWSAIEACAEVSPNDVRELALRIRDRRLSKSVAIDLINTTDCDRKRKAFIDSKFADEIGRTVFIDRAPLSIYKDWRRESELPHKRVHVRRTDGTVVDIALLSKAVAALTEEEEILRYYFVDELARRSVLNIQG